MNDPPGIGAFEATLESVLITDQLNSRPTRPPEYETENRALLAVAQHMADSPRTTLQKLAEVALEICRAGSAGVSLLSAESGDFYWPAIAGIWKPHIGGGTPREFGPCGVVLDQGEVQLFSHPERYYPYLVAVSPPIGEALLTPFYVNGKAVGTVWVIAHDEARHFDAEDLRLIMSLGHFAAAVFPLHTALDAHDRQSHSLRDVNENLLMSSIRQHELIEQAQNAEVSLRASEKQLEAELTSTQELQEISIQLIRENNVAALHERVLDAALAIMHADMACIQVLDEGSDTLRLLAFRGFGPEFGRIFAANPRGDSTVCNAARREGHRVVVTDVETCDFLAGQPELEVLRQTGIRAVQSTPLVSRAGHFLGVISTQWQTPHQPTESDLRLMDVLARQAADLIERSQVGSALRESEQRLRLAGAAASVGTWRIDLRTRLETRDASLNRLLDLEPIESTQPIEDFLSRVHPADRPLVEAEMEKSIREHGPYRIECRVVLPDGKVRWLLNQGLVIANGEEPGNLTGAAVDVTLQKGIEEALRTANGDLEQFGYSASHDLQEPIRNISVFGELLSKQYGHLLDEQGKFFLRVVIDGAERMNLLLSDLRAYMSSSESEQSTREEIPAETVLVKVLSDLSAAIREAEAEVSYGQLPSLWVPPIHLHQIFQNLIGNALKYRRNDETPRIHVSARREHEQWIFSVEDNGIGIAPGHHKTVFGIFQRLHNNEKYAGTGIGLAICHKLVERNGGRIWVESEGPGQGSTFYFTLPVRGT